MADKVASCRIILNYVYQALFNNHFVRPNARVKINPISGFGNGVFVGMKLLGITRVRLDRG